MDESVCYNKPFQGYASFQGYARVHYLLLVTKSLSRGMQASRGMQKILFLNFNVQTFPGVCKVKNLKK